jgi:outer membrane receptor protein involved in Fe transport
MEFTAGLVYTGTRIEAKLYGDTVYTSTNIAGYVSLDKTFFKKLTINAGARYEYNKLTSPEMVDGIAIPNGETSESKPIFYLPDILLLGHHGVKDIDIQQ